MLIWHPPSRLSGIRNDAHLGAHVRYVTDNLLMFLKGVTHRIPGVFEEHTSTDINVPLWTLPYELWLYVLLALMFPQAAAASQASSRP